MWFLARLMKRKLARKETAGQGNPDSLCLFPGDKDLSLRDVTELSEGLDHLHGRRLVPIDHHAQGLRHVLLSGQVDVVFDLNGGEMSWQNSNRSGLQHTPDGWLPYREAHPQAVLHGPADGVAPG